jgi:dienelactone hydrolase
MKYLFVFLIVLGHLFVCYSQSSNVRPSISLKPVIDANTDLEWPIIQNMNLSLKGNYVVYNIYNQPVGSNTLVMQGTRRKWRKEIVGMNVVLAFIDPYDKWICWKKNDSAFLQYTDKDESRSLGPVKMIQNFKSSHNNWIAWQLKNNDSLIVENMITGNQIKMPNVRKFEFYEISGLLVVNKAEGNNLIVINLSNNQTTIFDSVLEYHYFDRKTDLMKQEYGNSFSIMILKIGYTKEKSDSVEIRWIDMKTKKTSVVWKCKDEQDPANYSIDNNGEQLAFSMHMNDTTTSKQRSIWYYNVGMRQASQLVNVDTSGLGKDVLISGDCYFSDNNRWLVFKLQKVANEIQKELHVPNVDVWSYRDAVLNPAQSQTAPLFTFNYVMDVERKQILYKESEVDHAVLISGEFLVTRHGPVKSSNNIVRPAYEEQYSYSVLLPNKGKKMLMKDFSHQLINRVVVCPGARWIVYWDQEKESYLSFDVNTGKLNNISKDLPESVVKEYSPYRSPLSLIGWLEKDSALLVCGNYDIWKIALSGSNKPVCITNGFGRRHAIKLRIANEDDNKWVNFKGDEELLLSGLNQLTKYNGFFSKKIGQEGDPELLTMGPYNYYQVESQQGHWYYLNNGIRPLNNIDRSNPCWVVMRQSATEFPNYYFTEDFKIFQPITDFKPQKKYNWLTADLISWKMLDGKISQGILYKPENFDSSKKYPVIFNYYEKLSHRLFQFPTPGLTQNNINIPWFVSRGYLVFTPDIYYSIASKPNGKIAGDAACNSVISAARYLSTLSFVDGRRIAIQGHSFGGLETSYIVSHSNEFAAAAEMAGTTDYIASYLTLVTGLSKVEKIGKQDHPQGRMDATPWERPELYIKASTVLSAHNIKAPLLITHNLNDDAVNFRQGVELYMSMRRLSKPCWLLQYDNSKHSLSDRADALDYTLRLTQFFDHYLKGEPAPIWMTRGMPAYLKGAVTGYELDPSGNCGEDCKVCKRINALYAKGAIMDTK